MRAHPRAKTMSVTITHSRLEPAQMMMAAPVTRMMRPVPRSGWAMMAANGTSSVPQSFT